MPIFNFEAMGANGEPERGQVEAANADAAKKMLRARGLFVTGLRDVALNVDEADSSRSDEKAPDSAESGDVSDNQEIKEKATRGLSKAEMAFRNAPKEPAFWTLIGSNAVTGWFAIHEHWPAITVCWAFCLQTAIMAVFSYFRIRYARKFMFGDYHLTVNGQRLPNTRDGLQLHARAQVVSSAILMGILLPGILVMSSFSWHQLKEQIVPLLWVTAAFFGHSLLDFAVARVRTGRPEHIGSLASTPMIRSLTMLFLLFLVVPALMLMDSRWYWIPLLVLMALVTAVDILLFALKRFTDTELNNLKNGEEP